LILAACAAGEIVIGTVQNCRMGEEEQSIEPEGPSYSLSLRGLKPPAHSGISDLQVKN
jgi:hypothetical protein